MKVGILIYSLAAGGAERQVSYMTSYFLNKNIETCIILMNDTIKYNLPENIDIFYLEKSNANESGLIKASKIPILALKYSFFLKANNITHSVSMLTRANFINIIARKFTNYPFKLIINELAFPSLQYSYKGLQSKFNKLLIKKLYKKSDLVIGNSNGNINDLIQNFNVPKSKCMVVHNPINISQIENSKAHNTFYDSSKFNIISIGRLDAGKNHAMLIKAIYNLNQSDINLYIFGEGILKKELNDLIIRLQLESQIFLMGYESNPFKYLKAADLFIFGSNHEGFPNVLLEAMACGLPILTTNCQSGPSEIMELDSELNDLMITKYGILVPIKNTNLMSKGIQYFINNKEYRMSCRYNAKKRIKDFDKNKILTQYLQVIKSV